MASAALVHQYTFNDGTADDGVGTADGTLMGNASVSGGQLILDGASILNLPGPDIAINTYSALTMELWLTSSAVNTSFTMAAAFGRTFSGAGDPLSASNGGPFADGDTWRGVQYLMIQPTRGGGPAASRVALTALSYEAESGVNGPSQVNDDFQHMLALTIDGTDISYYIDGAFIGSTALGANTLASLSNERAMLGQSVFPGDPLFVGSINEFSILDNALSGPEIADHFAAGPVPEPSTFALIGMGLAGLAVLRRRRASKRFPFPTDESGAGHALLLLFRHSCHGGPA